MNKQWLPTTRAGRFWRVVEELGEVLQAAGKAGRFGLHNHYPPYGPSNAEKLIGEVRDLQHAALSLLGFEPKDHGRP